MLGLPLSDLKRAQQRDLNPRAEEQRRSSIRKGRPTLKITSRRNGDILASFPVSLHQSYPLTKYDSELLTERLREYNTAHETIYTEEDVEVRYAHSQGGCHVVEGSNVLFSLEKDVPVVKPSTNNNTYLGFDDDALIVPGPRLMMRRRMETSSPLDVTGDNSSDDDNAPVRQVAVDLGVNAILRQLNAKRDANDQLTLDDIDIQLVYIPELIKREDVAAIMQEKQATVSARVEKMFSEMFNSFLDEVVRLRAERFVAVYSDLRDQLLKNGHACASIPNDKYLDTDLLRAAFTTGGFQIRMYHDGLTLNFVVSI